MFNETFVGDIKTALDTELSTTEYQTVENGTLDNATSEQQMKVVSSSSNDSLAGTGAQKVMLSYLDSDFNLYTEVIEMNGTSAVSTVSSIIMHIEKLEVIQTGSNDFNVGSISLKSLDGTKTFSVIESGKNDFFSCVHHVPVGKNCYITGLCFSLLTSGVVYVQLRYEKDFVNGGKVIKIFDKDNVSNYGSILRPYSVALRVEEKNHIRIVAKATSEGQQLSARFYYFEVTK